MLSRIIPVIELVGRLLGATGRPEDPEPEEVVSYEGHIYLDPADVYGDGSVLLVGKGNFVSYLYEQLDIPSDNGSPMHANLYGRITVEVLPDPDLNWWP